MNNDSLASFAIECALDAGCNEAKVTVNSELSDSVEWRNNELDYVSGAESRYITIGLYVDGRYSTVDTNRLDPDTLRRFIATNVENTRRLAPDPFRYLPTADQYFRGVADDLDLVDHNFNNVGFDTKSGVARQLCLEMTHRDTISATAAASGAKRQKTVMTSNGFTGHRTYTHFSLSASISINGGDEIAEDYDFTAACHWHSLSAYGIGKSALKKATAKLGARHIGGGKYDVVVDRLVVSKLLNPLINAIGGEAQYYKNSFLLDMKGEKIASPLLSITDMPTQRGMPGAAQFDVECRPLSDMPIIENGRLSQYLISLYMSRKMNTAPTRAATTIVEFGNRKGSLQELVGSLSRGLLVTGFNGGNCNGTTGDFSFGIEGFLIEKGIITQPIAGMLMTGNMLSLWNNLTAVADDAPTCVAWHTPSLLFSDVNVR